MGRIVVLDSGIIICLAGGHCSLEEGARRIKMTLKLHREAGDVIALPTAALAECCDVQESMSPEIRRLDFNTPAAILANRFSRGFMEERGRERAKGNAVRRQDVKVDSYVLATAVAAGANILYTLDTWFEKVWNRARNGGGRFRGKKLSELDFEVKGIPTALELGGEQTTFDEALELAKSYKATDD